ncbi:tail fiber assembly protein [Enterobacter roggenkampii]|uniref:tail fiber assembly protein n=1 Tax=Enterobacter roggenkampii TaxID=1812935 RepID=UPI001A1FF2E6|nr:tail fiber assembly protein [Enterobacter roggenkampii]HAT7722036.1 tail fiber assembly protein [Enterobacter roggenkampii]
MAKAKLNNEHIATVAGDITVFNYDCETREYLSSSVEHLPIGVGIPANSCIDAPGEGKEGFAICRTDDLSAWEYIADHRGEVVYSTHTGEEVLISILGDYPTDTTVVAPTTSFDKWDGSKWIIDSSAKRDAEIAASEQLRKDLISQADEVMADWRVMLMLGDIGDEDKEKLSAWMGYKKELKAVDVSTAPDVSWPAQPEV